MHLYEYQEKYCLPNGRGYRDQRNTSSIVSSGNL
jgi:hypothetical protein